MCGSSKFFRRGPISDNVFFCLMRAEKIQIALIADNHRGPSSETPLLCQRNANLTAFHRRADDGQILNAGLVAL